MVDHELECSLNVRIREPIMFEPESKGNLLNEKIKVDMAELIAL